MSDRWPEPPKLDDPPGTDDEVVEDGADSEEPEAELEVEENELVAESNNLAVEPEVAEPDEEQVA